MVRIAALLLAIFIALTRTAGAAEIEVAIEPDPPIADESFSIAFTARGSVDGEPDFSPLEPIFEIVSRNRQTSIKSVNGHYTRQTQWLLNVIPKRPGPIELPSIGFGRDRSPARRIEPVARADHRPADDGVFLEVEAAPKNPYVQQQVIYTLRLWRRVDLSNAGLTTPETSVDTIVKPLGDDRHYEAIRDGRRYDVIERRFAMFPQASGPVTIAPAVVTAQIARRSRSVFDRFGQSVTTRRITSEPIELEVKPIPPDFPPGATWLPASKLRLHEAWEPEGTSVPVGEPVTRTVFLWADGLTAAQLPAIDAPELPGARVYPDQPQMKDELLPSGVTSVRQDKVAVVPSAEGEIELPPIELPWWNTETDSLETARLPVRVLHVEGGAAPEPPPAEPTTLDAPVPTASQGAPVAESPAGLTAWRGWFFVALASLLGWALTTGVLVRRGRRSAAPAAANAAPTPCRAHAALKNACARRDAAGARDALLAWARERWPTDPPLSLGGIAARTTPPLAQVIERLNAVLYANAPEPFDAQALWNAYEHFEASTPAPARAADGDLPPLFKLAR